MDNRITAYIIVPLSLFCLSLKAQPNGKSYKELRSSYNTNLNTSSKNISSLLDSMFFVNNFSNKGMVSEREKIVESINAFNEKKFQVILDFADTVAAKEIMQQEISSLVYLNSLFSKSSSTLELEMAILKMLEEIGWLNKRKPDGLSLENSDECFFAREIEVFVIKKTGNKMDTLACYPVKYHKKSIGTALSTTSNMNSYSCTGARKKVSTGKWHVFNVAYDGKETEIIIEVPPCKSVKEILKIELIIP